MQPSAAPYHDWNERIEAECYRPVTRCSVIREAGSKRIVNALSWMSFNFGPTLMVWLETEAPGTYEAILAADRESAARLDGHGNALAMPYHHPILPLSTDRDRRTEVRWGVADFRRRFGREPEGMWLPETAVDSATLDVLAEEGIRFTVLAPHQVDPVPSDGLPGLYVTPGGHEIALFVYDGALSHGVAFGDLLEDGVAWANLMIGDEDAPKLRSMATDGETFGHHHKFGEMGLASAVVEVQAHPRVRLENYASFLAREGVSHEVRLVEPSAWSCAHGVERWRADCGCRADSSSETSQAWRGPLRSALEWLADGLHEVFEREGAGHFDDPWAARDAYGAVVGTGHAPRGRRGALLEMERNALRLFTSCAWFFDDVGGLEPRQVLSYAARAIELAGADGLRLETGFLKRLEEAVSNRPEIGSAADVYRRDAEARRSAGAALGMERAGGEAL